MKDTILETVLEKYNKRAEAGQQKYNTTLDREDLFVIDWLTHLQEELMDATLYIEKLRKIAINGEAMMISNEAYRNAEKIVIDGFVFVKYSDLNPLPF